MNRRIWAICTVVGGSLCHSAFSAPLTMSSPAAHSDWYQPKVGVRWHWQLQGKIRTHHPVSLYDIDLFDTDHTLIQTLQAKGRNIICYFSAGSFEDWREDAQHFLPSDLGKTMDGWEDERWLDIRSNNVRKIMKARLQLAAKKGCDGVEPDNMDGYSNQTGFALTAQDQLAFNKYIARQAHALGLAVGLKNDLDQVAELVTEFDFAVNEQCFEYNECHLLLPFITQGKPVLNAEYKEEYRHSSTLRTQLCQQANAMRFSTLLMPLDLDGHEYFACW